MIARISGTGSYAPARRVTNEELSGGVHMNSAGILRRTGIRERRWADKDQAASDLAVEASRRALDAAGCPPMELDAIILSTTSPDMWFPSTACLVQEHLGAHRAFAFDLSGSCCGFLFALSAGEQYIRSGRVRTVLVVASEVKSRFIIPTDPATGILFGDGAGAVILQSGTGPQGIQSIRLYTDGSKSGMIRIPGGGSRMPLNPTVLDKGLNLIQMRGGSLFKMAVHRLTEVTRTILEEHRLSTSDVHHFIFHQANARILSAVAKRLSIPLERIGLTLDRFGNTSSASVPMTLDERVRSGAIRRGERVFLAAFGGGLNWGGALIDW